MSDPLRALQVATGQDVAGAASNLPNIPAIPASDDAALVSWMASVKAWLEAANASGVTGFATKADLIAAGVLKNDESGAVVPTVPASAAVPPVPSNLTATGAVESIIVSWDNPLASYGNHAYAEVWAAGDASFTNALLVGQASGFMFAHVTGDAAQRWYWVRFVSTSGVKGPFSAVNGVPGASAVDPADVFAAIVGTEADKPFFTLTEATVINGVSVPPGTYIKEAFIAALNASKITAGDIAADRMKAAVIAAVNGSFERIVASRIDGTNLNVVNGTFSGELYGANGTFSGALAAATGTFGGSLLAGVVDMSSFAGESHSFNAPGTYTLTVPSGKPSMRVTLLGGGGGGGGGGASNYSIPMAAVGGGGGGGGGAGTYASASYSLTAGDTVTINVGNGGAGGNGAAGSSGAASTVSAPGVYLSAAGGSGGGVGGNGGGGGAGGSIGGSNGTSGVAEVYDGLAQMSPAAGGNGGAGGSSAYGTRGAGAGQNAAGSNGTVGCGGGGGGGESHGNVNNAGGNGGAGLVIVEFFNTNSVVLMSAFQNFLVKYNALAAAVGRTDLQYYS